MASSGRLDPIGLIQDSQFFYNNFFEHRILALGSFKSYVRHSGSRPSTSFPGWGSSQARCSNTWIIVALSAKFKFDLLSSLKSLSYLKAPMDPAVLAAMMVQAPHAFWFLELCHDIAASSKLLWWLIQCPKNISKTGFRRSHEFFWCLCVQRRCYCYVW